VNLTEQVETVARPGRLSLPPRERGWWVYAWRLLEEIEPTEPMPGAPVRGRGGELGRAFATVRWP